MDEELGSPKDAFANALSLLEDQRTDLAERQLREILDEHPDEVNSLRLLGVLRLAADDVKAAIDHLGRAVALAPGFDQATLDLGRAYRASGRLGEAIELLRKLCAGRPKSGEAWQALGDALIEQGDIDGGRDAFRRAARLDPHAPRIGEALEHLRRNRRQRAEAVFRDVLKANPDHIHALVGLANIALDAGVVEDAERLLRRAQALAPNLDTIWRGWSRAHSERADHPAAQAAAERAVALAPDAADCWTMLGTVQAWGLKPEAAKSAFERSLALKADQPRVALSLGHVLKTLGERPACEAAYRRAVAMDPSLGEAFWSLADLKTYRFGDGEIDQMRDGLARNRLPPTERAAFHFALGKALEDRNEADSAFEHYAAGNAIKHRVEPFDGAAFTAQRERIEHTLTADFLAALDRGGEHSRAGAQAAAVTPIFVVGMPRSGSTLVEQILASHSAVRGTMELPQILTYVREFGADGGYPQALEALTPADFEALGERYLRETQPFRGDAAWFIDKMPNNFIHLGLIRAMLPQAVFIDARREPMDCCFSIFKQNFARGQAFSYDLRVLGAYYQDYLRLMRHWRQALPGAAWRCQYEELVASPEDQVRQMLHHCGLGYEAACLRFHETRRAVRTASAEQVRQPLYQSSVGAWRRFERQLQPLREALGPALNDYIE